MNLSLDELRTVQTLYERSRAECEPGYCWHTVLDDGNFQDLVVGLCMDGAIDRGRPRSGGLGWDFDRWSEEYVEAVREMVAGLERDRAAMNRGDPGAAEAFQARRKRLRDLEDEISSLSQGGP